MKLFLDKKFLIIVFVGIIFRGFAIYFMGDNEVDNEWGIMLNNLDQNQILSVRSIDGIPVPNIFMPPLYPIFLYLIKIPFSSYDYYLPAVFLIQLIMSVFSIYLIQKIFEEIFTLKESYLGTVIFTLFPLNIYAVSQISSITLQILLINLFLLSFIQFFKKKNFYNTLILSISSALLILLRGEFFVFVIFSLIFAAFKKRKILKILFTGMLILLLVSPYIYRNYNIFGVVTITKSSGYNLLKGNHPNTVVEGTGMFGAVEKIIPDVAKELNALTAMGPIPKHDLLKDKILLNQALVYIKADPIKYLKLYFQKLFSFIFIDFNSSYPNYYSIFHLLPKILLSITTILGIVLTLSMKFNLSNYFIIFYFSNIFLFSFFFILPRYSLSLLTIQIILSLYGLNKLKNKFNI